MARTFQTPHNQAKKRKIISVTVILVLSAGLIIYQLIINSKESTKEKSFDIENVNARNSIPSDYTGAEPDAQSLLIRLEEMQSNLRDHEARIADLEDQLEEVYEELDLNPDEEEDEEESDDETEDSETNDNNNNNNNENDQE